LEGRGSSFTVFIPAHSAPNAVIEPAMASLPPGPSSATILVADDNEQLRIITARILRAAGYEVIEASDGVGARTALAEAASSIDLIISDLVMPGGVLGDELAHEVLKRGGAKFILMSSSGENFDLGTFEAAGGRYIGKPFDTAQLLAVVRSTLDPKADSG
jgi:DNA-binding response OmpR family regulator